MLHNLFPQPVGIYQMERALDLEEDSFVERQETRPNIGNTTSIDHRVLDRKELSKIRSFIESSLAEYFGTVYAPKHKVNLKITQSWINYTKSGQWHHKHNHPNSFVSGVFYLQAKRETDRIYFYRDGFDQIRLTPETWNVWNSNSWWFEVGTGDLIIFPSHLTHMVETVKDDHTRISLSFNTFPVGVIGEDLDLTGLQIGEFDGALR